MIYLNSDTTNTITVTLNEKSTLVHPFYTWCLKDIDTKENIVFTADDYSSNQFYYNQFSLSVFSISATQTAYGLTNGSIYANSGAFEYTVFEMYNQYDLNLDNAIGVVETGLLTINGTYSPIQSNRELGTVYVNKNLDY